MDVKIHQSMMITVSRYIHVLVRFDIMAILERIGSSTIALILNILGICLKRENNN